MQHQMLEAAVQAGRKRRKFGAGVKDLFEEHDATEKDEGGTVKLSA